MKGFEPLEDRTNAVNDPSYLHASLSDGQLPRDKFIRIESKINLNGFVTKLDYTKAITELQMTLKFDDCKLLFIYLGCHGVAGDKILFSDGHTVHYTDVVATFRKRLRMMNKPIILLTNFCRDIASSQTLKKFDLPIHEQFVLHKQQQKDSIQSDAPSERYIYFDDRNHGHHNLAHTGLLLENALFIIG